MVTMFTDLDLADVAEMVFVLPKSTCSEATQPADGEAQAAAAGLSASPSGECPASTFDTAQGFSAL